MYRILTTFSAVCFSLCLLGQIQYQVLDQVSNVGVAFAKVYPSNAQPLLTDLDGYFTLPTAPDSLTITAIGYVDSAFSVSSDQTTFLMRSELQEIQEVVVLPGENPAHRIINLAIANRKANNPVENDAFQYAGYTKFVAEFDPEVLAQIPDTTTDSTLLNARKMITHSHLFLIETHSKRTFIPPYRDQEEVTSYKVSGQFRSPAFATLAQEMQSFSFYENQVKINGVTYINPIAFGGTRRYLFQLKDTTFVGADTVFHISFRPRKNKSFEGMKGMLFINTKGYAIEKVIAEGAEISPTAPLNVKIVQEYAYTNNFKWFPTKLTSEMTFPTSFFEVNDSISAGLMATSHTYIDSVTFDPSKIDKIRFNNVSVVVNESAANDPNAQWDSLRKKTLTEQERNTYALVDSVSKAENLTRFEYIFNVLSTGKIPLKYVNAPIDRLFGYNNYEGFRLGLGLETSDKVCKPVHLGGYFAYGFRDKAFKWGGHLEAFLYRPKDVRLKLEYSDDVEERGGRQYLDNQYFWLSSQNLAALFLQYMDRKRTAEAALTFRPIANLQISGFSNYSRLSFLDNYQFNFDGQNFVNQQDVFEVGAAFFWRIRDKFMVVGDNYISKGSPWPTIYLRATQGVGGVWDAQTQFTRLYTEIQQKISLRGVGKFSYLIAGGQLIGDAPMLYSHRPLNSINRAFSVQISLPNTFETMAGGGYFLEQYAGLFTRLDFNKIKRFGEKFRPQIALHHAIGYGSAVDGARHNNFPQLIDMEQGYFEGGLLVNSIWNNLGLGVFYHYGPGSSPIVQENLFLKLSSSLTF